MKQFLKMLYPFLLLAFCVVAFAQVPIQKSSEKVRIDGKTYFIHYVKKGETLYSLSKAYEVTVQQIVDNNPLLADGLKDGQNIKIPAEGQSTPPATSPKKPASTPVNVTHVAPGNEKPAKTVPAEAPKAEPRPAYHLVRKGETLWSIATKYETSEAVLKQLNPDAFLHEKLMVGALLQLPDKPEAEKDANHTTGTTPPADSTLPAFPREDLPDSTRLHSYLEMPATGQALPGEQASRVIKAALLLPLVAPNPFQDNPEMDSTSAMELSATRLKNMENFYAFYEGALLAMEELKEEGLLLQLSVHNSYEEKNVNELILHDKLLENDIIIGPVYANTLKPVAHFAKEQQIKIVSPLDPNAETLTKDNPYFFQVSPPVYCRQKKLVNDILTHKTANIVMIYEDGKRDSVLVHNFKELFGEHLEDVTLFSHHIAFGTMRDSLPGLLSEDKPNVVLVASNNEALVSDAAANLYLLTFRNQYDIVLYGTERWRSFETIDLKYFHTLNLRLVVPFYIDYEKEAVMNFTEKFYERFHTNPSQYAFQGYDTFYYFLQAMMRFGNDFEQYLPQYNPSLLQTDYVFKYAGSYSNGLVNVQSSLINYTPDYTVVRR
jgi:LysM repeat protein